jgi:hypothetical protein
MQAPGHCFLSCIGSRHPGTSVILASVSSEDIGGFLVFEGDNMQLVNCNMLESADYALQAFGSNSRLMVQDTKVIDGFWGVLACGASVFIDSCTVTGSVGVLVSAYARAPVGLVGCILSSLSTEESVS